MSKSVLITGASRNIGKSICEKFINEGFMVYGTYNTTSKEEISELKNKYTNLEMYRVDFSNFNSTTDFISKMKNYKFDVIVNNAGMMNIDDSDELVHEFNDFCVEDFIKVMNCNFYAPLRICIELRDNMKHNGSIVNIASTDGMNATYASISYSASKAALINLTSSLANNYFQYSKVRVNGVAPGWIDADDEGGMNTAPDSPAGKASFLTPIGRNGKTKEVADVVFYLTQKESFFINGTTIIVDGGFSNSDVIYYEEATGESLLKIN